jgi:HEAT repeat protein
MHGRVLDVLWAAALIEALLIVPQIGLLWFASRRYARREATARRLRAELMPSFLDVLDDPVAQAAWCARVRRWDRAVVREELMQYLKATTGAYRARIREVYAALGLLDEDRRRLRSRFWTVRMRALRRLAVVAGPEDHGRMRALLRDRPSLRLLAAQVLARVGDAGDVLHLLATWPPMHRLQEHPVRVVLESLPPETFAGVVERWDAIADASVRRVLLVAAAQRAPAAAIRWLDAAARSPDKQLRIGAALAAGELVEDVSRDLLLRLLGDAEWEVRAHAAKGLGRLRDPAGLEPLAAGLRDRAFWVRQNAAAALYALGADGRRCLMRAAETSDDRFARDTARQELARHRPVSGEAA